MSTHQLILMNAIVFGCLTVIWSNKNWPNLICRMVLVTLTIVNVIAFLK